MSTISFAQLCNTPAVRDAQGQAADPQAFRAELRQAFDRVAGADGTIAPQDLKQLAELCGDRLVIGRDDLAALGITGARGDTLLRALAGLVPGEQGGVSIYRGGLEARSSVATGPDQAQWKNLSREQIVGAFAADLTVSPDGRELRATMDLERLRLAPNTFMRHFAEGVAPKLAGAADMARVSFPVTLDLGQGPVSAADPQALAGLLGEALRAELGRDPAFNAALEGGRAVADVHAELRVTRDGDTWRVGVEVPTPAPEPEPEPEPVVPGDTPPPELDTDDIPPLLTVTRPNIALACDRSPSMTEIERGCVAANILRDLRGLGAEHVQIDLTTFTNEGPQSIRRRELGGTPDEVVNQLCVALNIARRDGRDGPLLYKVDGQWQRLSLNEAMNRWSAAYASRPPDRYALDRSGGEPVARIIRDLQATVRDRFAGQGQAFFFSDVATRDQAANTEHRVRDQDFARAGITVVNPAIR